MIKRIKIGLTITAWALWAAAMSGAWAQGSLTPPGAPGPTMKTLAQVEPRTPITNVPYTITQPGSYYLVTNLTSTGDGVVIAASGVTLDLMGFTLAGDRSSSDYGVFLSGATTVSIWNVVVRNGTVRNFGYGLRAEYSRGCRFENMAVGSNTYDGIRFYADGGPCDGNTIANCAITRNNNHGIIFLGGAEGQCSGNTIVRCAINSNSYSGIFLDGNSGNCNGNAIDGCAVSDNVTCGIYIRGYNGRCVGNTVSRCVVSGNRMYGIYLIGGDAGGECNGNTVTHCTVSGSGDYGIRLTGAGGRCEGNTVSHCTIRGNADRGLALYQADGNRVEDNHISGQYSTSSTTYGISCTSGTGNFILRNTCVGQTNNFSIGAEDTYGPIVTNSGELASTGAASHPWANFSR